MWRRRRDYCYAGSYPNNGSHVHARAYTHAPAYFNAGSYPNNGSHTRDRAYVNTITITYFNGGSAAHRNPGSPTYYRQGGRSYKGQSAIHELLGSPGSWVFRG